MKKAKSNRLQRSKIDTSQYFEKEKLFEQEKTILQEMLLKQEKQLAEMTATVNGLAITIQRDNFKKGIDRWESGIERIRRTLLELVSELRQVAEKWKVTGHSLNEIDDLQQRNEERIGQLLTISNAIKILPEKAIDDENIDAITNFIADCSVAIDTIADAAFEEWKEIADKLFLAVAEEEKLLFEEYSYKISQMIEENDRELIKNVSKLRIIAGTTKDDQLIQKIDVLEHHVEDKGKYLLNEVAKLKVVPEVSGADAKFKVSELERVLEEVADSYKRLTEQITSIVDELEPYIKAKRRKRRIRVCQVVCGNSFGSHLKRG